MIERHRGKKAGGEEPTAANEGEEAMEQQQNDSDERYGTVGKIKLVHEGKRVKIFRVTRNSNRLNTKMIMANVTPCIEMRGKVIYSFKSVTYRGGEKTQPYSKTLDSSPGMFTSLKEIQVYIEECEQQRLDLDNEEVWSQAYLPATRTSEVRGNYEGTVVFKLFQIRLVGSN